MKGQKLKPSRKFTPLRTGMNPFKIPGQVFAGTQFTHSHGDESLC